MSNPSTDAVCYPYPYSVVDGCLYMETTNKNGKSTRKLCNFLPYLTSDVTVDDGAVQSRTLQIAGIHESGRMLPEIEVSAKEFKTMDWALERWGADCIIEPGKSNKDWVCNAIQQTVKDAEKKTVYHVTGWKKIDGKWTYLLPNDESYDVRLFGKLNRYRKAQGWSDTDLRTVWSMMKEKLIAPQIIVWTLIAYVFLTPLNEFLHQVFYEPKFVLYLIGRTGTRKSTLAALFLSFFGKFNGSDLPMSFCDTQNSILNHISVLKDTLTCIDDFHPGVHKQEMKDTDIAQAIDRAYGDRVGKGRLNQDCTAKENRPPHGNAIVTGETIPAVGESGTARAFILEFKRSDVNLENLSFFQKEAKQGTLMNCLLSYIEWIQGCYLHNDSAQEMLRENLTNSFESYREEFLKAVTHCHGRVAEIVAWLTIGMAFFLEFLYARGVIEIYERDSALNDFRDDLYVLAEKQSKVIEQDKPTHVFIQKLYSLIESGQAVVLNRVHPPEYLPKGFVGYEDDENYYLNADAAHTMVKSLCEKQDEHFTITKNALLQALAEEGILERNQKSGKNTKSLNVNGKTKRLLWIPKSEFDYIVSLGE